MLPLVVGELGMVKYMFLNDAHDILHIWDGVNTLIGSLSYIVP